MDNEVKNYIRKIFTAYNNDKEFSYGVNSTIRELDSLVLFNKRKDSKEFICFSLEGSDKHSNIIERLLEDDLLGYIKELMIDAKVNKYNYTLDELIRVTLACFYRFTTTNSFMGIKMEGIEYSVVRSYIEDRYRIKLGYYLIYKILEKELSYMFLPVSRTAPLRVLDFKPTGVISDMLDELFINNHIEVRYKDHYLMSLRKYVNNEFTISKKICSEMRQGILKIFLKVNLEKK